MTQYELNLRDYWRVIQKRYPVLIVVFIAVLIPTIIYTNMQKPLYRASASVQWVERQTLASLLVQLVRVNVKYDTSLLTQSRIIMSLPILEKVVVGLGLVGKEARPEEIRSQAAMIRGAVSTEVVSDTNIIRIVVSHEDPQLAAQVANKITEVYIIENLREKSKQSRTVREFIERQLQDVSVKLKAAEETLARFKETEAPSGIALPLQGRLESLYAEHQNLLQKYTAVHPNVKNAEEQIAQIKSQLKTLPYKELEYSRLHREVEINARLYSTFKDKLAAARIAEAEKVEDVSLVEPAAVPVSPISPNRQTNYFFGAVVGFMLGLTGIFLAEQLDTSIGTIEDVESYIGLPILGVIPFSPLAEKKRSVFPLFPRQKKDALSATKSRLLIHPSIPSSVIEAYRMLDTNFCSAPEEKACPKIITISSTVPGEGKTIISANLAITMAQRGAAVLLIDADLRRPLLYRLFGLKRDPGLADILSGNYKAKDVLRNFTDLFLSLKQQELLLKIPGLNNLQLITPGHLPDNPVGLFSSGRMSVLMDELRKDFGIVIFDCPPILPVSDVSILGPKADAVILVYQIGKTSRSALQRAKKQMEGVGAKLKGIVLNCLDPQVEMNRPYYYHYYRYYGKSKEKDV